MKSNTKITRQNDKPAVPAELVKRITRWPITYPAAAETIKRMYLSGQWSFHGAYEQEFSGKFARFCDTRHGIVMINGTVTLESALHALGVGAGDEVIVPANTWLATALAAVYLGARPVFVDVEPHTLCLDPVQVRRAITRKTKAIIPVHLFGSMADMDLIMAISRETGIPVIEDCAHAHGGIWNGRHLGSIGHIGSFSFQQSKTMSSGEGGICVTNDERLAERLFRIKHVGYKPGEKQGKGASGPAEGLICHNYRSTEFASIILLEELKHLQEETERRDANAIYLTQLVKDIPGITVQSRGRKATLQGYYGYVFLLEPSKLKKGTTLAEVAKALAAEGVEVSVGGYGPVYKHPLWSVPRADYKIHSNEVAEWTSASCHVQLHHTWLLAGQPLMRAVAEGVRRVMERFSKGA